MKDGYTTLKDIGEASFTEKKSEFIGSAMPVQTEEEALEFIAEIKKKHSTARHNVYAYVVRENNIIRFTEDGEPKGTAGSMVLVVLKKSDITDAVIVVTRYFGGILLGTGGLARAYTKAASDAINAAGIAVMKNLTEFKITCSFRDHDRIKHALQSFKYNLDNTDFSANVTLYCSAVHDVYESIKKTVTELTADRASIEVTGERFGADGV